MKGIMEMRMETVPARHTGDLCTGLICKWRDDEEKGLVNFTSWELDDKVSVSFQFFWQFFVHFEIEICVDYCERKARQCGKIFGELRPNVIVRILSQGDYIGMYMYVWYVYWYSPKERQLPAHTTGQIGTLGNSAMRGIKNTHPSSEISQNKNAEWNVLKWVRQDPSMTGTDPPSTLSLLTKDMK